MGETENLNFHDFWIFGPVGTLIYGFEYAKSLFKIGKWDLIKLYCFLCKFQKYWISVLKIRKIMKMRLISSWKSWMWDQHLPEKMNGILVVWDQYLLTKALAVNVWKFLKAGLVGGGIIMLIIFGGPKRSGVNNRFESKNEKPTWWNLNKIFKIRRYVW